MEPLEQEIDRLYGISLNAFVSERNDLAKRLRAAGDRVGAARAKALDKPSLPAWAVNQLVRHDGALVQRFLQALDQLSALLSDGATGDVLRSAAAVERSALHELTKRAASVLLDDGHAAKHADRVAPLVRGAAMHADLRGVLEAGRLERGASPSGIDAGAFGPAAGAPARKRSTKPGKRSGGIWGGGMRRAREARDRRKAATAPSEVASTPSQAGAKKADRGAQKEQRRLRAAAAREKAQERRRSEAAQSVEACQAARDEQRAVVVAREKEESAARHQLEAAEAELRNAKRELTRLDQALHEAQRRVRLIES